MKKTALQQLIDYATDKFGSKSTAANDLICQAMMLMKTEKQDIIEAYHEGQRNIFYMIKDIAPQHDWSKTEAEFKKVDDGIEPNDEAEQYYTQTFKQ